ncbi:hypothetical protein JVT61DRAFT_12636 [Boletus reticuloceps]|uniref:Uncharacterized protein n=1 Tax=Boletus reticuloceps TaxID=495285 RepID=A0A8I3ADE8_9AGAM|nr:hypothetical protein JVT61DRAFT_12636 [Boletus reticuloceps]
MSVGVRTGRGSNLAVNLFIFTDPEILLISAQHNMRPSSPERSLDATSIANGVELVTETATRPEHRTWRTTMNSNSVEKQIKGISKVVAQSASFMGTASSGMIPLPKSIV